MAKTLRKPELIVIAGPNGSGKTSVTQKFLHHEWADGTIYINPDQVANEKFGDWNSQEAIIKAANYCAEWREECLKNKISFVFENVPIRKIVSRYTKSIINCETIARLVDRLYVYDNSVNDRDAQIQFRLSNGKLEKMYVSKLPNWAKNIIPSSNT